MVGLFGRVFDDGIYPTIDDWISGWTVGRSLLSAFCFHLSHLLFKKMFFLVGFALLVYYWCWCVGITGWGLRLNAYAS